MQRYRRSIVWFRRDLRLDDHTALYEAARQSDAVVGVFVLDPVQLGGDRIGAANVQFFFESLADLRAEVRDAGSDLAVLRGDFAQELTAFARRVEADAIFYNLDYEPLARTRDAAVEAAAQAAGLAVHAFIDHVYFGSDEVRKDDGAAYTVFTPFKRRWLERHEHEPRTPRPSREASRARWIGHAAIGDSLAVPSPEALGYQPSERFPRGGSQQARRMLDAFLGDRIARYDTQRNFPDRDGTSQLSPHLRAGTIGIRTCVAAALEAQAAGTRERGPEVWLSELIWREFYVNILANFPHVANGPFIEAASQIPWRDDPDGFAAWCEGRTGYPIVDAAMRQLNATGWMHNRLRMIAASFLTKDLLIDWRLGEHYFERRLADADLAANNGGWQWSASTGTDAAPYFRVFNPILQSEKFDPHATFITQFVPELAPLPPKLRHAPWLATPLATAEAGFTLGIDYPLPIVEHAEARKRTLAAYAPVLGAASKRERLSTR
jgi:deoxyribodipyrimidine photo-lyase